MGGRGARRPEIYQKAREFFEKNNRKLRNFPFTNRISNKVAETLMNSGRKQSERWRKMRLAGMNDDDILKSFDFPIPMRIFSWIKMIHGSPNFSER